MSKGLVPWERLVRYVSQSDGEEKFGEPILNSPEDDIAELGRKGELEVVVYEGRNAITASSTGERDTVEKLLGPLRVEDVPIVRCIGLNYKTHIAETGRPLPECPTVFTKPSPAIADHDKPIPIPRLAQSQCDYEGELTVLIGRDAKDVAAEDALDYVAAYTCGNDVSARDWQREPSKAGVVPQWSFSKSFDKYAPLGPCLVSASLLGAAENQKLRTYVNGELRQEGSTADLCHGVRQLVAFCSQGQTLQQGSLIMTGTPGGVGLFMKPPCFLKDGDEVVVEISGIGKLRNTMNFL
jgi:2-keto-4-pentenoate hydratase/2-oxohepta-3-ene-1,7-dioic acid hydratase in catechol pathway